jgi:citrate lyase alpha subunit
VEEKAEVELKRRRSKQQEIPDNLLPPLMHLGLEVYFDAFANLSTTRAAHNAPISWLSTEEYADRLGFDDDVRQELHHHVRHLDRVFLEVMTKTAKERQKGRGNEDKGGHPQGRPKAVLPPRRGGR